MESSNAVRLQQIKKNQPILYWTAQAVAWIVSWFIPEYWRIKFSTYYLRLQIIWLKTEIKYNRLWNSYYRWRLGR